MCNKVNFRQKMVQLILPLQKCKLKFEKNMINLINVKPMIIPCKFDNKMGYSQKKAPIKFGRFLKV